MDTAILVCSLALPDHFVLFFLTGALDKHVHQWRDVIVA